MKVLVCGDRHWTSAVKIRNQLKRFVPEDTTLIHGAAPGADSIAMKIALELKFAIVESHPAQWDLYGRAAGPIRNRKMLERQPDVVLAFHSNLEASRGTKSMVTLARKANVPVEIFK